MRRHAGGIRSLAWKAGRPATVPPEIQGRRRADPRCESCTFYQVYRGPTAWTGITGSLGEASVCNEFKKELVWPEAKRRCPRFSATIPGDPRHEKL